MLKHYVEVLYPGIMVCESSTKEVQSKDPYQVRITDKSAFAFRFFDREETELDGETLVGKNKNYSGLFYLPGAKIYTYEEAQKEFPTEKILLDNMRINGMKKIIKTRIGNFQEFRDADALLAKEPAKLRLRG